MLADDLRLEDCVNDVCPWSGEPVSADSLTLLQGQGRRLLQHRLPRQVRGGDARVRRED